MKGLTFGYEVGGLLEKESMQQTLVLIEIAPGVSHQAHEERLRIQSRITGAPLRRLSGIEEVPIVNEGGVPLSPAHGAAERLNKIQPEGPL